MAVENLNTFSYNNGLENKLHGYWENHVATHKKASTMSRVTRVGLDNWPLISCRERDLTVCHSIHSNYAAYTNSCSKATLSQDKWQRHAPDHSFPSNVEVKNELSYSSNFLCACIVCTGIMSLLQSVKIECFILNMKGQCWIFRDTSVLTRGIMECTNETSLFSSVFMYRTIRVSEWYELNTGWVRNGDVRRKLDWNMLPWLTLQLAAIWNNSIFKKHKKQLSKWSIGSLLYR